MPTAPQLPDNAPFSPEQKAWLNGWIAGVLSSQVEVCMNAPAVSAALPMTILYGTQTGTAEGLAKKLAREANNRGFEAEVLGMDQYSKLDLTSCERLLCITSTYGDGDPPDNAMAFWQWLSSEAAPALGKIHFSVLALGDTNYERFCQFGKVLDARMEELGASRLLARVDCDVDYDSAFKKWLTEVLEKTSALAPGMAGVSSVTHATDLLPNAPVEDEHPLGSKGNPFLAALTSNQRLTTSDASKETRHFEIHINGLRYEVGDALGVTPTNDSQLVEAILKAGSWSSDDALRDALQKHYDLTNPSRELLHAVAARSKHEELGDLLKPERSTDLKKWLYGRDVLDVLSLLKPGELGAEEFAGLLKKLQPRLYSIASSLKANPGHVHLTIAQVRYESLGRLRSGVCSTFLADRVQADIAVPVYVQPSHGFRLPADTSKPVIMVGPGTGIAPFRAFLQERQIMGGTGKNWLFFGEQSRKQSYFYKDEWATMMKAGSLHRMDTAFSRDQEQKIYVQHRMTENGAELFRWLEEGAHFYVCGDASRMAKDVDAALHEVIQTHGGKSADEAKAYVSAMKEGKRYARDVY